MSPVFKTFIIFCFFLMNHINKYYLNQEQIHDEPDELEWGDEEDEYEYEDEYEDEYEYEDEDEYEYEDFEFGFEYILWLLNDFISTLIEYNVEQLIIFILLIHVILKDIDKEEDEEDEEDEEK